MNWIMNKLKALQNFVIADCCAQTTEPMPLPPPHVAPTVQAEAPKPEIDYAKMSMPELRGIAAERDLGDGRYKGVTRRQLTKLIKEN